MAASSNLQKIVKNNFHLNVSKNKSSDEEQSKMSFLFQKKKPWVLSKNTNEIVNTCIQKIYKQMPHNFKKDLKPAKIAAARPENKGPIRCYQALHQGQPNAKIVPQSISYPSKKSSRSNANHSKSHHERLVNILKASTKHNLQINTKSSAAITAASNKKLLKSPNFKIYGARRFGSSASSSRSSLFRRYDERRRQKQPYMTQLNYLIRSFHTGRFNESIAKYIMPSRNQQVKGNLGSVPEAMKVSSSIQNDLMIIDATVRNRISVGGGDKEVPSKPVNEPLEVDRLQVWKHPPPLDKFCFNTLSDLLGKSNSKVSYRRQEQHSPEHRDFRRYPTASMKQFKNPSPTNEDLPAHHEHEKIELQEKHRRNRMKKLGLIKESPKSSATLMNDSTETTDLLDINTEISRENLEVRDVDRSCYSKVSPVSHQMEACRNQKTASHFPVVKMNKESASTDNATSTKHCKPRKLRSSRVSRPPSDLIVTPTTSEDVVGVTSLQDERVGPLALATANFSPSIVANANVHRGYRHNRSSYFPQSKY